MKRPAKVTKETRPNQYARKMLGKGKTRRMREWEEDEKGFLPGRGVKKKIRTSFNRRLRRMNKEIADGGAYRKQLDMEEEK